MKAGYLNSLYLSQMGHHLRDRLKYAISNSLVFRREAFEKEPQKAGSESCRRCIVVVLFLRALCVFILGS